jgi:hypothetical protein
VRRVLSIFVSLAAVSAGTADTLRLRDGRSFEGDLVAKDDRRVAFRVRLSAGDPGMIREFPVGTVAAVIRDEPGAPSPEIAPRQRSRNAPADEHRYYMQMLREVFELIADDDRTAAIRALQRLVSQAPNDLLTTLSAVCQTERGIALDELLAQARLADALARAGDGPLDLPFATRFESAALCRLLTREYEDRLAEVHDGRTVLAWIADYQSYTTLTENSRSLALAARRAGAALSARLRFDHALRKSPKERKALFDMRDAIGRLVWQIETLRGYTGGRTSSDPRDPAVRKLRELLERGPSSEGGAAASQPAGPLPPPPSDDFPIPDDQPAPGSDAERPRSDADAPRPFPSNR